MLLEGEVSLLEGLRKIQVLIQFVAIDGDLDPDHRSTAPNVVAHFQLVSKPRVRLYELLIDVTESVQRPGANRIAMGAVDLGLVTVRKSGLGRRAEVEARVAAVVDLDLGAIAKVPVRPLGTHQHRRRSRTADCAILHFPNTVLLAHLFPPAK